MRQYLTILLFSALSFFTSVQVHALDATTGEHNPLFSVKNKDTKVSKEASTAATFFYNTTVAKHTPQQAAQLDAALDQLSLQTLWDAFLAVHGFEENTSCAGTSVTLALAGDLANPNTFYLKANSSVENGLADAVDDVILASVKGKFPNISSSWFDDVSEALLKKMDDLPTSSISKFEADIASASGSSLKNLFKNNPNSLKAWDIISGLPQTVRTKILNLEATAKLDAIKLWTDPSVLKTKLPKVITSLDGAGADGASILNKIKAGTFDDVDGYKELIKSLTDANKVQPVKQAINKADEFPGVANNLKKFEFEDQVNKIDVDFGTLSSPGGPPYSFVDAFQFKFANTVNAVKNRITGGVNGSLAKINNATAQSKVLQINMKVGTKDDVLNLPDWNGFINAKKAEFPDVEIRIYDSVGSSPLVY